MELGIESLIALKAYWKAERSYALDCKKTQKENLNIELDNTEFWEKRLIKWTERYEYCAHIVRYIQKQIKIRRKTMTEKEALLVTTLKLVYQKFFLQDTKIGKAVVEHKIHEAFKKTIGEKEYEAWLCRLKFRVANSIIE